MNGSAKLGVVLVVVLFVIAGGFYLLRIMGAADQPQQQAAVEAVPEPAPGAAEPSVPEPIPEATSEAVMPPDSAGEEMPRPRATGEEASGAETAGHRNSFRRPPVAVVAPLVSRAARRLSEGTGTPGSGSASDEGLRAGRGLGRESPDPDSPAAAANGHAPPRALDEGSIHIKAPEEMDLNRKSLVNVIVGRGELEAPELTEGEQLVSDITDIADDVEVHLTGTAFEFEYQSPMRQNLREGQGRGHWTFLVTALERGEQTFQVNAYTYWKDEEQPVSSASKSWNVTVNVNPAGQLIAAIIDNWVGWLIAGVIAILGVIFALFKKRIGVT